MGPPQATSSPSKIVPSGAQPTGIKEVDDDLPGEEDDFEDAQKEKEKLEMQKREAAINALYDKIQDRKKKERQAKAKEEEKNRVQKTLKKFQMEDFGKHVRKTLVK